MWEFVCKKENPTFTAQKPVKCFSIILQGVSSYKETSHPMLFIGMNLLKNIASSASQNQERRKEKVIQLCMI